MFKDTYQAVCDAAKGKAKLYQSNPLGFWMATVLAGIFIAFGGFVSIAVSAPFYEAGEVGVQKLLNAVTFSVALCFVLMCGGELFTGSNLVLGAAGLRKELRWSEIAKLWAITWIGNFIGSILAVVIFELTGMADGTVAELFASAAEKKMTMGAAALFCRGIFCNMLVCMAVWCSIKMKTESGKLIMVLCCIVTFVICGFEHSVANMTTLTIGMLHAGEHSVSPGGYLYNLVIVTAGNLVGGVLFVACPYHLISRER